MGFCIGNRVVLLASTGLPDILRGTMGTVRNVGCLNGNAYYVVPDIQYPGFGGDGGCYVTEGYLTLVEPKAGDRIQILRTTEVQRELWECTGTMVEKRYILSSETFVLDLDNPPYPPAKRLALMRKHFVLLPPEIAEPKTTSTRKGFEFL